MAEQNFSINIIESTTEAVKKHTVRTKKTSKPQEIPIPKRMFISSSKLTGQIKQFKRLLVLMGY